MAQFICRLCEGKDLSKVGLTRDKVPIWQCNNCGLNKKEESFWLLPEQERERYSLHQNSPESKSYQEFLLDSWKQLAPWTNEFSSILDFGCGPEKALETILEKNQGLFLVSFDPYFYPKLPNGRFTLIFCSEVFEHLREPKETLEKILSLGEEEFILGVRTESLPAGTTWANWSYANDPTHIHFWNEDSLSWMAKRYAFRPLKRNQSFWIFQKIR